MRIWTPGRGLCTFDPGDQSVQAAVPPAAVAASHFTAVPAAGVQVRTTKFDSQTYSECVQMKLHPIISRRVGALGGAGVVVGDEENVTCSQLRQEIPSGVPCAEKGPRRAHPPRANNS